MSLNSGYEALLVKLKEKALKDIKTSAQTSYIRFEGETGMGCPMCLPEKGGLSSTSDKSGVQTLSEAFYRVFLTVDDILHPGPRP